MAETAYATACRFSIIWPNVFLFFLPVFSTEWSRVAIRLIPSTGRLVRAWTGHCNERNSSQIDDDDDDDIDDDDDDGDSSDGSGDDDNDNYDKDNDEDNDYSSSDGNGDDGDNDGDDDDDVDDDDDDDVHVVCLLTCLTGVPWIWWSTFAGTCVVVQFSTIVAQFATTVYNIINKLSVRSRFCWSLITGHGRRAESNEILPSWSTSASLKGLVQVKYVEVANHGQQYLRREALKFVATLVKDWNIHVHLLCLCYYKLFNFK